MRREKDLDKVDVHARAIKAAERTVGSNGQKQHALHFSQAITADEDAATLWERIQRFLPQPEVLNVAGRVINKGIVLTPTMALTLFLAMAGVMGTMYYRMTDTIAAQGQTISAQNELLIRLDQRLIDKDRHDVEYREEIKREMGDIQAWQQVTNKDLARLLPRK